MFEMAALHTGTIDISRAVTPFKTVHFSFVNKHAFTSALNLYCHA